MTTTDQTIDRPVHRSGTFSVGGKEVHRLGYGAMQITGAGRVGRAGRPGRVRPQPCGEPSSSASTSSTGPTPTARRSPSASFFEARTPIRRSCSSPPRPG